MASACAGEWHVPQVRHYISAKDRALPRNPNVMETLYNNCLAEVDLWVRQAKPGQGGHPFGVKVLVKIPETNDSIVTLAKIAIQNRRVKGSVQRAEDEEEELEEPEYDFEGATAAEVSTHKLMDCVMGRCVCASSLHSG